MTQPAGHTPQTSHRVGSTDAAPSGTALGADTTARMSGTQQVIRPTGASHDVGTTHAKTSAAAVFALVFGLAALFCALTAILSPAAVLFGVIGIVLGIVGLKMAKRVGVTGRGVAIGGLVTAVLGLLLGGAVLGGLSALVNDDRRLDQLQNQIDNLRDDVPTTGEIREQVDPS
jgi:hypothetical protein